MNFFFLNMDKLVENFMCAKNIADMPSYEFFPDNSISSLHSSDRSMDVDDDDNSGDSSDKEDEEGGGW